MTPKTLTLFFLGLSASVALHAQTYCVPPPFTSGPFTGIISVNIDDNWDNTSLGTVGYMYYDDVTPAEVTIGEDHTISVEAEHTLTSSFSGNLNYRVWIDWNQDGDFDDADEEVLMEDEHYYDTPVEVTFTVPDDAEVGVTRMRVYEDMPVDEGHDYPEPCGYLNSTNPIGHHGECEDYDIEILAADDGGGNEDPPVGIKDINSNSWSVITSANGHMVITIGESSQAVRAQMTNLVGQTVYVSPQYVPVSKGQTIDVGAHAAGIYIVQVEIDGQTSSQKVYIH